MKISVRALLVVIFALLMVVGCELAHGQTATVGNQNSVTIPNTNTTGVPVHLRWGAISPTAGWTLIDYCVGWSLTPGQEHAATTQNGIVYKGCTGHVTGLSFDVFPFLGPQYYVVWAELLSTDGTKVALSADSNEASCDLEVLSSTATTTTFWCKDQVVGPPVIAPATNVTAVAK